tara:strand:- start:506 stop:1270 length:765 start_codon:yes stop_codon:yes gene_type:complete
MEKHDFKDRKIWLTGASSGIGYELACLLIQAGAKIVVSARTEEKLNQLVQLSPGSVKSIPFDVKQFEQYPLICQQVIQAYDGLDIIILNAGNCKYIDVKNFQADTVNEMMQVNFMSMVHAIEQTLPCLRKSKYAHIVAVSSSAAFLGLPRAEAYGTSKAAIKYFFESLRADLDHQKVAVYLVFPGFVKTPLTDKNNFPMPLIISAEKAAKVIYQGIQQYKQEIKMPWIFIRLIKFIAILPVTLRTKIVAKMAKK